MATEDNKIQDVIRLACLSSDETVASLEFIVRMNPGFIPVIGPGTTKFQPVAIEDVATVDRHVEAARPVEPDWVTVAPGAADCANAATGRLRAKRQARANVR